MFIVFDGPVTITIGNQSAAAAERGAFGFAPRFATHAFGGIEDGKATSVFSMNSPAGHDRGFEYSSDKEINEELLGKLADYGFQFHPPS